MYAGAPLHVSHISMRVLGPSPHGACRPTLRLGQCNPPPRATVLCLTGGADQRNVHCAIGSHTPTRPAGRPMHYLQSVQSFPTITGAVPHQSDELFLCEDLGRLVLYKIVHQEVRILATVLGSSLPNFPGNPGSRLTALGLSFPG